MPLYNLKFKKAGVYCTNASSKKEAKSIVTRSLDFINAGFDENDECVITELDITQVIDQSKNTWNVYLIECSDGTYYTGISNNWLKRVSDHNNNKGAKYTRGRTPVKVKAVSKYLTKERAAKEEYKIKHMKRDLKIDYVNNLK